MKENVSGADEIHLFNICRLGGWENAHLECLYIGGMWNSKEREGMMIPKFGMRRIYHR